MSRYWYFVFAAYVALAKVDSLNDRPIIGVLSQELSDYQTNKFGYHSSYIAASYVKYLEGAGARVVPIMVNQSFSYYENIINSTNGVLFPGGAASFEAPNGYADAGWILYHLATTRNDAGVFYPLWATCLGFELLTFIANNRVNILTSCDAENIALPLQFKPDFSTSKLFGNAPENIINSLRIENVTANFHHKCVTEANMTEAGLDRDWRILSLNNDIEGLEFISAFEHNRYPFYGVQFHPEKNIYEWKKNKNNPHSTNAIMIAQFFANFFINEAKKNNNHFRTEDEEEDALIYNFNPEYTGKNGSAFEQCYLFDNDLIF